MVLAYGAPHDNRLGVAGEDLPNVYGSNAFVGWYNGHPDFKDLNPDLDVEAIDGEPVYDWDDMREAVEAAADKPLRVRLRRIAARAPTRTGSCRAQIEPAIVEPPGRQSRQVGGRTARDLENPLEGARAMTLREGRHHLDLPLHVAEGESDLVVSRGVV